MILLEVEAWRANRGDGAGRGPIGSWAAKREGRSGEAINEGDEALPTKSGLPAKQCKTLFLGGFGFPTPIQRG